MSALGRHNFLVYWSYTIRIDTIPDELHWKTDEQAASLI